MNRTLKLLTLAGLALAVACSSDKVRNDDGSSGSSGAGNYGNTGPSSGAGSGGIVSPSASGRGGKAGMPGDNVVYFEFDSSDLKPEGMSLVNAWASYLAANPNAKVRLEGHTDERGTREYNIGLGERRGNSVMQALTSRGVAERQVNVSSFGEERPVSSGRDESAWSQNRRVEIVQ